MKILWIGDGGTTTGFGKVHAEIAGRLKRDFGHEIHTLAVMYEGKDPDTEGLNLYRAAAGPAHHFLGFDRVVELLDRVEPDVVIANEDAPQLMKRLTSNSWDPTHQLLGRQPILAYLPVDGYNLPPTWGDLTKITTVVPYTRFGADLLGLEDFVYHGVDRAAFHPATEANPVILSNGLELTSKEACRAQFDISPDAFVIGRVDTNTGRKDWGSTWKVITKALPNLPKESMAFWHTKLTNPASGVDIASLVAKAAGKFLVTNADDWPTSHVVAAINCFDVFLTTTRGEGFGLTIAEAMACAVPVIATDGSAMAEIADAGGYLVEPKAEMTNPYGVDLLLADVDAMAERLVWVSKNRGRSRLHGANGMVWVHENLSWDTAAAGFNERIAGLVAG